MLVLDTNIWISFALNREGRLGKGVAKAIQSHPYAFSEATFAELTEVLFREKFDPFVSRSSRIKLLKLIGSGAEWFTPRQKLKACRDPKDDKFLDLAVAAQATHIITGDTALLALDPFQEVRILTISDFLNLV